MLTRNIHLRVAIASPDSARDKLSRLFGVDTVDPFRDLYNYLLS